MRITDTERGARMALEVADIRALQFDLFEVIPDQLEFWSDIRVAALDQLDECALLRQVLCL
ncbi:hypothetical protein LPH50_00265 [Xylella taiwanensis]|uniref:Uncharacterized protein n=1 Tax=Xylella taiwanensis TaxID=1444770 RepID=A0ABS8TZ52_9GAMM|nr:hypothetical protein [Xylella taiwanensis]AXI83599.1 hypothetical protein AB672_06460 [Xylella taiwanensis]MCD8456682.1 hypothetical protein [Xylella taiwanensis]MCD8462018.1 hypothetical protein [Xylella taiwanensis]MCD8464179.1 hypothetical protein [Xylella taiwanensis]MCD8465733.1 hypothetical protein [Xylella taiwanensis]